MSKQARQAGKALRLIGGSAICLPKSRTGEGVSIERSAQTFVPISIE
ncbi:MAG: hypothetical protein AAF412_13010 [Pseudomonadota bacterium]